MTAMIMAAMPAMTVQRARDRRNDASRCSTRPGASVTLTINYYLPMPMPSNWTVTFGGRSYALAQEARRGAVPAATAARASTATRK